MSSPEQLKPFVEVALPVPIRKTFTYKLPEEFAQAVKVGSRILVPFGKRTLTGYAVGFTTELKESLETDKDSIKTVVELIDDEPLVTDDVLQLTKWAAEYYSASWGEMLKASLPAGINAGVEQIVSLTGKGRLELIGHSEKRSKKAAILNLIAGTDEIGSSVLAKSLAKKPRNARFANWFAMT